MIIAGKKVTVGVRGVVGVPGQEFTGTLLAADELGVAIRHQERTTIMFPWASVIWLSTEEGD